MCQTISLLMFYNRLTGIYLRKYIKNKKKMSLKYMLAKFKLMMFSFFSIKYDISYKSYYH